MKKVRFNDLFDFAVKSKIKAGDGNKTGKHPFYTSSPQLSKYLDSFQYEGEYLIFGTGGSASIHYQLGKFSVSTDCFVVKPKMNNLFNPKYIYHYLLNNINIIESGFKGAGLKHLSKSHLANIIIPIPSFSYQNQVVTILDTVSRIIRNHSEKLEYIELFKESYFNLLLSRLETFEEVPLRNLIVPNDKINYGVVQPGKNLLNGVPIIKVGDISDDMTINQDNTSMISHAVDEKHRKSKLNGEEILLVCVGATIGKIGIVPESLKGYNIVRATIRIRPDGNKINKVFLAYYLNSENIKQHIKNLIRVGGKPTLNINQVKKIVIKVPSSLDIQKHFEDVWNNTEILKQKTNKVLNDYKEVNISIAQKAFLGELKTNINAFSFDDQVTEYSERKYNEKEKLNETERLFYDLRELLQVNFYNTAFTFQQIEELTRGGELEIEYDYPNNTKKKGLKDFIFEALDNSNESGKAFLKQIFQIDENKNDEFNHDESHIAFIVNS